MTKAEPSPHLELFFFKEL